MWRCRTVELLIRVLPVSAWQDFLIRRHVPGCAACSAKLAAREEAQAVLVHERDLLSVRDFWPAVSRRLRSGVRREARPQLARRWVSVAVGLLVVGLVSVLLLRVPVDEGSLGAGEKLRIDYVRVGEEPARAYVFQPQDADVTLVWVERSGEGE
jgi:hypothetical protein